jgi:D-hexose-6-phosphate mutarotase
MIAGLNRTFGIEGHLRFEEGAGSLPRAAISNAFATAEVYLHGAHVTAFRPRGAESVLWMSELAVFEAGKAIRGGIPVVWPWFGPHPGDEQLPQHGFARVSDWTVDDTRVLPDGRTQLRLKLVDDGITRQLWPHPFNLDLTVVVGSELRVGLTSRNAGTEPVTVGGALHTYFRVGDIGRISIEGLDGGEFMDQLDDHKTKRTEGKVTISGETDRVYLDTTGACAIFDPSLQRTVHVGKSGSQATVLWNPWIDKSRRIVDFPDDGYRSMVCIEAANAFADVYVLPPGGEHTLAQTIAVKASP